MPSRRCNALSTGRLPEGRYGRRWAGTRRRWVVLLTVLVAALAGLGVAVLGYRNLGPAPVRAEVTGYTVLAADAVQLRVVVSRDDPSRPAVCIVRARSRDGEETGRRELYVPPASGPLPLTTVVHTSRPPVTADVYGCSFQVPAYLVPTPPS